MALRIGTLPDEHSLARGLSVIERLRGALRARPGNRPDEENAPTATLAPAHPGAELARALEAGEIDIAVLPAGAVSTDPAAGISLCAFLAREEPWEAWVSAKFPDLIDLPDRARVAAGTALRRAQLLHCRPDLEVVGLAAAPSDPIAELVESDARGDAGIILAAAALRATGRAERIRATLTASELTPAAGQGAWALAVRADDAESLALAALLDDAAARAEIAAERAFVAALDLEGDLPIGAVARRSAGALSLVGIVATLDGDRLLRLGSEGTIAEPTALGERLAAVVLRSGGREIAETLRSSSRRGSTSLRGATS